MAILFAATRYRATDKANQPISGAFLSFYATNTSTFQPIYADAALSTVLTNPVKADDNGLFPEIWLDDSLVPYKVIHSSPDTNNSTIPGSIIWSIPQYNTVTDPLVLLDKLLPLINPLTDAETAAGVTPTDFSYPTSPYIDPRRYGAKLNGVTDDSAAWVSALKVSQVSPSPGTVIHPGGVSVWAKQILIGTNVSIKALDRTTCVIKYTGDPSASALRITNNGTASPTPNTSGFGRVNIEGIGITTNVGLSTAAAIEINACGYAYYNIRNNRVTGTFKYGIILDGTEVTIVESNIIDNSGPTNSAGIWLTNGSDRTTSQSQGFTNSVWIQNNQINGQTYNIADDGGSNHYHNRNNLNGAQLPIRIAGVTGFEIHGNEVENGLSGTATGEANLDFLTISLSSVSVGPCQAGTVAGNFLGADMAAGGSTVRFGGSGMHQGIRVESNWFRNNGGRTADIDVTQLSNSYCGQNFASALAGQHYTGVHVDNDGNVLWPPQNGYTGGFSQSAYVWGDSRFRHYFATGIRQTKLVLTYSASMTPDCRKGNIFQITATNSTAFTINAPTGDATNGDDGTYVTIQIKNTSGGALGAITFGTGYKLAGAFTAPATGNSRSITFYNDTVSSAWYEVSRTSADVPN